MSEAEQNLNISVDRAVMAAVGAIAGFAFYALVELLPDLVDNERVLFLLAAFAAAFFGTILGATGALSLRRAALVAALIAVPSALLVFWSSYRFGDLDGYIGAGHGVFAYVTIVFIGVPFLIAAQKPAGWRNYWTLFNEAWNIVVRYAVAWIFTGIVWGVVFLSDQLLKVVGLEIIETIIEIDWVPPMLTGAVLGLALAVVNELRDYVSPFLVLRLLRLLLPVVLAVVAVFLAALPFRGLSGLFGDFSAAATLMAMAFGATTLVTSAIHQDNEEAVQSPIMRIAVQAMSLLLPILTGLAAYAIWLRVAEYGWTPTRIAATTISAVLLGYAVLYAMAVIARGDWMRRIRGANVVMALAIIAIAVLWMTPILNPERISIESQLARLERGEVTVEEFDLWEVGREWGVGGEAALERIAAMNIEDKDRMAARIERLRDANNRYTFVMGDPVADDRDGKVADLVAALPVFPEGESVTGDMFAEVRSGAIDDWNGACARLTPLGNPGCALVLGDFLPEREGMEGMMFWARANGRVRVDAFWPGDQPTYSGTDALMLRGYGLDHIDAAAIDAIVSGEMEIGTATVPAIRIGERELVLEP